LSELELERRRQKIAKEKEREAEKEVCSVRALFVRHMFCDTNFVP